MCRVGQTIPLFGYNKNALLSKIFFGHLYIHSIVKVFFAKKFQNPILTKKMASLLLTQMFKAKVK